MAKAARIYEEMAAAAHHWGYDRVTAAAVHNWKKRGLLPDAIVLHSGFGGSKGEIPAQSLDQLQALCRLRYVERVRDLSVLGLLLWLDGCVIEPDVLRRLIAGAIGYVDRELRRAGGRAKARDPEDPVADLDAVAIKFAKTGELARSVGGQPQDPTLVAVGLVDFFAAMTGRSPASDLDPEALEPVGLELGLGLAGSEAPDCVQPWLSGNAGAAMKDVAVALNPRTLRERLGQASNDDLEHSRDLAATVTQALLPAAEFVQLVMRKGQFGLGSFQPDLLASALGRVQIFFLCLALPDVIQQQASSFEAQSEELTGLVELGRRWLAEHPEHAEAAAAHGLAMVIEDLGIDPAK